MSRRAAEDVVARAGLDRDAADLEQDVIRPILRGESTAQIAARLCVSPHAVR